MPPAKASVTTVREAASAILDHQNPSPMSRRPLWRLPPNALRERYKFKSELGCSASGYGRNAMVRVPESSALMAVTTPRCIPLHSVPTDHRRVHTHCRRHFKLMPAAYGSKGCAPQRWWITTRHKNSHLPLWRMDWKHQPTCRCQELRRSQHKPLGTSSRQAL